MSCATNSRSSEYKRISAEIYAEDAARRAEEEAARTYAAYHVTERGQEWYFKTSLGEELLDVAEKLRGYVTAKDNGIATGHVHQSCLSDGQPITVEEYNALTALRMENTGKVRGVFDVQLRQAGVLRRSHHGRLADLGDAGCIRGGVPCHTVAIRVER